VTALVAVAPAAVARATIAHHSKSFALASRLLGRRLGDQTAVIYTWCRRADDAVDEAPAGDGTIERLDDELVAAYDGRARDPVLAAFGEVARDRGIPLAYPRELLAGMAMDVRGSTYVTIEDVIVYAWRVAGVVGLMMTHVFGVADDAALVPAAHLGIAMQLTNICRDVGEDARRGRVYLPQQWIDEHGLHGARQALLALADRYYASADTGIAAKRRWKVGAYMARAAMTLSSVRSATHRVTVDGKAHDVRAAMLLVLNCGKLPPGFFKLRESLAPDDGWLDVVALDADGVMQSAMAVFGLLSRSGKRVWWGRGREVRVEIVDGSTPRPVQLDGEVTGATPFEARLLPGSLLVLVGPDYKGSPHG